MRYLFAGIVLCLLGISCTKESDTTEPKLVFRFKFDSTQARLNNQGLSSGVPEGYAAQSPVVNNMSVNSIELSPDEMTSVGAGTRIYLSEETTEGGDTAINFARSVIAGGNEVFYAISLKDIKPGEYEYLRLSVAYQNYTVQLHVDSTFNDSVTVKGDFDGTMASFIGYNNYISTYTIKNEFITVDENRLQGYWGLEVPVSDENFSTTITLTGQSPEGSTTIVNPLHVTSPLPAGSSIITASFAPHKLVIAGDENKNIIVEVSLSTNKSFVWKEIVADGKWEPLKESVADMGLRGMIPTIQQ